MTIHEPLPLGATDRGLDPRAVVNVAGVPPKLELGHVAVQMLLADVVEGPHDAPLEKGEEPLDGVRGGEHVPIHAGVFVLRMKHRVVAARELTTDWYVLPRFKGSSQQYRV